MLQRTLIALLIAIGTLAAPASAGAAGSAPNVFTSFAATRQSAGAYTPQQIASAYDLTPLSDQSIDGSGQTIALIEYGSFRLSDIQYFDQSTGLPDPSIQEIYLGGKQFTLPSNGEAALDIEWAHALAPGAAIKVYYLKNNVPSRTAWSDLARAMTAAANSGAGIISMSYGSCRADTGYTTTQRALASLEARGVSVFVSSGDSGALPGPTKQCGSKIGVPYPASDPSVTAVGGTSLQLTPANTILSEVAWQLSGGGKGQPLLRPKWQVAPQLKPGKYRWAPDVAFLGDDHTGVEVYYHGRWLQAGGTSLGAPAWAAIWALARQAAQGAGKTLGAAPPLIYQIANSSAYTTAFHDVTQGDNGRYVAGPGWDPVTGWGTPDVNGLVTTLLSITPGTSVK